MPLVLVHNDVVANPAHVWNDVEGVRYHYPSKYQGKIKTGEPFVYYRGVHRTEGKRGPAEYVGTGRIGTYGQIQRRERMGEARGGAGPCEDRRRHFGADSGQPLARRRTDDRPRGLQSNTKPCGGARTGNRRRFPAEASNIKAADNSIFPPTVVAPGAGRRATTGTENRNERKKYAIPADSFARCVLFAMSQPEDMDVNGILFRPTS
jgi:hypothetical protein